MKILYISPFDATGYGEAAIQTVLAMKYVGLDVVCRQIDLNNKPVTHPVIKELMAKSSDGCNICIQHVLPTQFDYNGNFEQNILFFALETNQLSKTWERHCKLASKIWMINEHSTKVLKKALVRPRVYTVPHPVDTNKFTKSFPMDGPIAQLKQRTGAFIFYTIGEFVSRKNYGALIQAYFSEFKPFDNVYLVVKTSKDGASPAECKQRFMQLVDDVKFNLKLSSYPPLYVITDFLPESELEKLHTESDMFVQTSHGEAWSLPACDALGYGKCPIVPAHTGYLDYVTTGNGNLIKAYEVPCYGAIDTQQDLYHGRQTWYDIDIMHLRKVMRRVSTWYKMAIKKSKGLPSLEQFSYQKVGNIIKKALNAP